jgi:beta-lactamase regulating signal transducer with metallopeptidase domain
MAEVLDGLIRANLVASLAVLAILALRIPARRLFGPEVAYGLWAGPPFAALATLLPLKFGEGRATHPLFHIAPAEVAPLLLAAWLVGFLAALAVMWRAQAAFLREARAGRAGPAVVGVITPRLLMPPDDGRYSEQERALIRAHEREHIQRKDPRAGAVIAACQCLAWFNPLAHLAARLARLDQELACDAAVLRRHPGARSLYARTLLKTQLAGSALPLGCRWPARARHPLEVRVDLLRRPPAEHDLVGAMTVAVGIAAAALLAWELEPPIPMPQGSLPEVSLEEPGAQSMSVMIVKWRQSQRSPRPAGRG